MDVLSYPDEPFDIEIVEGIVFTVRPMQSTVDMTIAQAAAKHKVDDLEKSISVFQDTGLLPPGRKIDLEKAEERSGFYYRQIILELGMRHIVAWSGVEVAGNPVDPTPELIVAVLDKYPIGEFFHDKFLRKHLELCLAKKECGAAAAGITRQDAAPDTARDAKTMDCPAPKASRD